MSHEAAISPWWAAGFAVLLAGLFVAMGVHAAREVLRVRRLTRARARSMRVHPSTIGHDLASVVADVDRQFAEPRPPRARDAVAPAEVVRHASAGGTTTAVPVSCRLRPFDLNRGDVLVEDESLVLGKGWPSIDRSKRTRFVVPVRDVFGVLGQRSWPMSDARFECVEVTR
jgi:hypothetical protein